MMNNVKNQIRFNDDCHPVKTLALSNLTEALHQERYGLCQELIHIAINFGANQDEIVKILHQGKYRK